MNINGILNYRIRIFIFVQRDNALYLNNMFPFLVYPKSYLVLKFFPIINSKSPISFIIPFKFKRKKCMIYHNLDGCCSVSFIVNIHPCSSVHWLELETSYTFLCLQLMGFSLLLHHFKEPNLLFYFYLFRVVLYPFSLNINSS